MELSNYLNIIRLNRNTSDGNGAHASYLLTEAQLDAHIKATPYNWVKSIGS